jgi:Rrf2 family cysteine metabolism transcriptional repressor
MNISSRCEYACRAIVELARHEHTEEPLTAVFIAERRQIPEKYLVHILLQLKRAGFVRSVRGAQGGYLLAQSADEITLLDIIQAIDGPILDPLPVDDAGGADLKPAWRESARGIEEVLRAFRVRDIVDRAAKANMYYI